MKTETQVTVEINELRINENLYIEPDGFIIKMFFSCSRADTKVFKINGSTVPIHQTLKIKNVVGNELEFWLCTIYGKIIANASLPLGNQDQFQKITIDFKMINTQFAKMESSIKVTRQEIEKIVYVEPDEELLKKVEDPYEKIRKEEEEQRKAKELADQINAAKAEKKAAITITQQNKKDIPFV